MNSNFFSPLYQIVDVFEIVESTIHVALHETSDTYKVNSVVVNDARYLVYAYNINTRHGTETSGTFWYLSKSQMRKYTDSL